MNPEECTMIQKTSRACKDHIFEVIMDLGLILRVAVFGILFNDNDLMTETWMFHIHFVQPDII